HRKTYIRIVNSSGATERESIVETPGVLDVYCSADGKRLYLWAMPQKDISELYQTDLQSQPRLLWRTKGFFGGFVWPSPDGRYLSINGVTTTSDAWLLENF